MSGISRLSDPTAPARNAIPARGCKRGLIQRFPNRKTSTCIVSFTCKTNFNCYLYYMVRPELHC